VWVFVTVRSSLSPPSHTSLASPLVINLVDPASGHMLVKKIKPCTF